MCPCEGCIVDNCDSSMAWLYGPRHEAAVTTSSVSVVSHTAMHEDHEKGVI
jgi:hypothetical protein